MKKITIILFGLIGIAYGQTVKVSPGVSVLAASDTVNRYIRPIAGTNITITGTFPNLTFNATASGSGTVTNIATGYGVTGGPITTTGTIVADTNTTAKLRDAKLNSLTDTVVAHKNQIGANTTAITGKQGTLALTTTGSSGAATLIGNTLNIPSYAAGTGTVTSFGKVDGYGIVSSVANPTTTPVHTITADTTVTAKLRDAAINTNTINIAAVTASDALKAPLASPTFTGTVTYPTPFTLGSISVTSTGTQLNYLNAATGTTGTTSTNLVYSTNPTLITPNLGTPSTLVGTNITGTASAFTAGNVTTNANLTGPITSLGNATSIASQTGTGTTFAMATSPSFTTSIITPQVVGSTAASGNLQLSSTTNATKGKILIGTAAAYDGVNERLGIGTTSPNDVFEVKAGNGSTSYGGITGITLWNSNVTYPTKFRAGSNYDGTYLTQNAFFNSSTWVNDNAARGAGGIAFNTYNQANADIIFYAGPSGSTATPATQRMILTGSNGNLGIGITVPTATLHLKAGTATAGTAPLKFTAGILLTTPESGVMETDASNRVLYSTTTTVASRAYVGMDRLTSTATSLTADANQSTIEVTATGQTITLPTAVGVQGLKYTIVLSASGSATIATTSSQTISGSTTYSLTAQYKYVTVQSNNSNWLVIANN